MSDFTPTARTNALESVNAVLLALGKDPVDSVPTHGTDQLTDAISNTLDLTTREVLSRGWHFNTVKKTLTESGGSITVDANILEFDAGDMNIAQKGDNLVHLDTGLTSDFTGDVTGYAILALQFAESPEPIRQYIVARSARKMAHSYSAETEFLQRLELEEVRAYRRVLSFESRTRNKSLLSNTQIWNTVGYRHRVSGFSRWR